ITRAGHDFSSRFPFIAMAVTKLPVRSRLIDGEAIVCDENGLAVFDVIRRYDALASAVPPLRNKPRVDARYVNHLTEKGWFICIFCTKRIFSKRPKESCTLHRKNDSKRFLAAKLI